MWPRVGTPGLEPSGYHTYRRLYHEEPQHFTTNLYLCVSYVSYTKHHLFTYTTIINWPFSSNWHYIHTELVLIKILQLRCQYHSTRVPYLSSSKQYYDQKDKRKKLGNLQMKHGSFELSGGTVYFDCQTVNGTALLNCIPSKLGIQWKNKCSAIKFCHGTWKWQFKYYYKLQIE